MREQELLGRLAGTWSAPGCPTFWPAPSLPACRAPARHREPGPGGPLEAGGLRELKAAFPPPDFELDEEAALRALARGIPSRWWTRRAAGGWTSGRPAIRRSTAPLRPQLRGRVPGPAPRGVLAGGHDTVEAVLGSPLGESDKQAEDALGVYEMQHSRLDKAYLRRWAAELGVALRWRSWRGKPTRGLRGWGGHGKGERQETGREGRPGTKPAGANLRSARAGRGAAGGHRPDRRGRPGLPAEPGHVLIHNAQVQRINAELAELDRKNRAARKSVQRAVSGRAWRPPWASRSRRIARPSSFPWAARARSGPGRDQAPGAHLLRGGEQERGLRQLYTVLSRDRGDILVDAKISGPPAR